MINKSPIFGVVANPLPNGLWLTHSMAEKMDVIPNHVPRPGSPSSRKIKKDWIAPPRAYQVGRGNSGVGPPGDAILLMKMKNCTTPIWVFPWMVGFPPKSSILIGCSSINHPFWGPTPIFGNTHMHNCLEFQRCLEKRVHRLLNYSPQKTYLVAKMVVSD